MSKYLAILVSVAAALLGLGACSDDMYNNAPGEPLELSQEKITVGRGATTVNVGVTARNAGWQMSGGAEWLTTDPKSGPQGVTPIVITFEENTLPEDAEDPEAEPTTRRATLTFTAGSETKTIEIEQLGIHITPPRQSPEWELNKRVHEELLNPWYYNGETRTTPGDYNQGYKSFYETYLSTLRQNPLDGNVWARDSKRYLYSYIERDPSGLNYGMEFDLGNYDGKLVGRVMWVGEGSPAATAGLKRGDWFWKVNNIQLQNYINTAGRYQYNDRIDTLVHPVEGFSPRLSMLTFQPFASRLIDEGRTVDLTTSEWEGSPILGTPQVIEAHTLDGEVVRTGYLALRSFDPEYETDIVRTFTEMKAAEVEVFVLDVRYSKTGTAKMANVVGNLLVPAEAAGQTFARFQYAEGEAAANNATWSFEPHESSVGVPLVFVLTSGHTTGAAELLINALRGLDQGMVKLVVIGDVTEGMNTGMVRKEITAEVEGEQHTYAVWIAAFRCFNAAGNGAYEYGFTPNGGAVNEWQGNGILWNDGWGWKGWEGATEDPLLRRAMDMVMGITAVPNGGVLESRSRQQAGYPRDYLPRASMTLGDEDE